MIIPLLFLSLSIAAQAIGVDEDRLKDPAQEARAQKIMKQLRCLVCQNQSIVDSDADLASDLRAIVREQIRAGKSDQEILDFMTSRYGDWVLLTPPFRATTAFLWFGPIILLLGGGVMVIRFVRRRPEKAVATPLTAEEEKRLQKILEEE